MNTRGGQPLPEGEARTVVVRTKIKPGAVPEFKELLGQLGINEAEFMRRAMHFYSGEMRRALEVAPSQQRAPEPPPLD